MAIEGTTDEPDVPGNFDEPKDFRVESGGQDIQPEVPLMPSVSQGAWSPPPWVGGRDEEGGSLDSRLAKYGWRLLAYLVDYFIVMLVTGLLNQALSSSPSALGVLNLAIPILYPALFIAFLSGATAGMKMVRVWCVDEASMVPPTLARSLVRSISAYLIMLSGLALFAIHLVPWYLAFVPASLDLLWPLWDAKNQTLHDKIARTLVLRDSQTRGA